MAFLSAYSKIKIYTANATFKLPYDWNPQSNLIAALAAGAPGHPTVGGGGGAFAWSVNVTSLTFQTVYTITVGIPANSNSSFGTTVLAAGPIGSSGGLASSCTGQNKFSGGNASGNAGGGAAGPSGSGGNASGLIGGTADGGTVPAPSGAGASGLSGTEFDATHGCGSGGNGGGVQSGAGGNYGGGGAPHGSNGIDAAGANGLVIVAYNPIGPSAFFLGM